MNRATRRRLERAGIAPEDLESIYVRAKKEGIKDAVEGFSIATAMVLRDNWGFGRVRLERFLRQVGEMFEDMENGYLSIDDCKEALTKECNIEFD